MDTNEAKKVCGLVEPLEGSAQRAIADHIERLEDWKSQASRVLGGLQLQEIAKEIGLRWGDDIGPAILPWIRNQKAQVHKVPMAPHTFAQMVNRVRDLAFDFGTTEQFRDRVSELLGEYVDDRVPEQSIPEESGPVPDYTGEGSAWVPPVEARAVVVPEIDCDTWNRIWHGSETTVKAMRLVSEWYLANARAIPAGRVPGDGMVAVDRVYLSDLEETVIDATESLDRGFVVCQNCGEQEDTKTLDVMSMDLMPMKTRIDALRANQEGAEG